MTLLAVLAIRVGVAAQDNTAQNNNVIAARALGPACSGRMGSYTT